MTERDERLFLADIKEAIDKILRYTAQGRTSFLADAMVQDAVVRNIEIIGEAVKGVSAATRDAHPEIPWRKIAGTRDHVIHGYFRVDVNTVWDVVEHDLPLPRQQLAELLETG